MGTFAITFRIKDDSTWSDRYESFMAFFKDKKIWVETTSFILLESDLSAAEVASALYLTSFSPTRDKLLVIDVTGDKGSAWGNIEAPTLLKSLMPEVIVI